MFALLVNFCFFSLCSSRFFLVGKRVSSPVHSVTADVFLLLVCFLLCLTTSAFYFLLSSSPTDFLWTFVLFAFICCYFLYVLLTPFFLAMFGVFSFSCGVHLCVFFKVGELKRRKKHISFFLAFSRLELSSVVVEVFYLVLKSKRGRICERMCVLCGDEADWEKDMSQIFDKKNLVGETCQLSTSWWAELLLRAHLLNPADHCTPILSLLFVSSFKVKKVMYVFPINCCLTRHLIDLARWYWINVA